MEIKLLLPKYLLKYMRKMYGEPYQLKSDNDVGLYLLHILERKSMASEYKYHPRSGELHAYRIAVNASQYEKKGCILSQEKIGLVLKYIDQHFRRELYTQAVVNYHQFQIPYKDTILKRLEMYDIDESDLMYETLRKDFNRKKGSIEERLIKNEE